MSAFVRHVQPAAAANHKMNKKQDTQQPEQKGLHTPRYTARVVDLRLCENADDKSAKNQRNFLSRRKTEWKTKQNNPNDYHLYSRDAPWWWYVHFCTALKIKQIINVICGVHPSLWQVPAAFLFIDEQIGAERPRPRIRRLRNRLLICQIFLFHMWWIKCKVAW